MTLVLPVVIVGVIAHSLHRTLFTPAAETTGVQKFFLTFCNLNMRRQLMVVM